MTRYALAYALGIVSGVEIIAAGVFARRVHRLMRLQRETAHRALWLR